MTTGCVAPRSRLGTPEETHLLPPSPCREQESSSDKVVCRLARSTRPTPTPTPTPAPTPTALGYLANARKTAVGPSVCCPSGTQWCRRAARHHESHLHESHLHEPAWNGRAPLTRGNQADSISQRGDLDINGKRHPGQNPITDYRERSWAWTGRAGQSLSLPKVQYSGTSGREAPAVPLRLPGRHWVITSLIYTTNPEATSTPPGASATPRTHCFPLLVLARNELLRVLDAGRGGMGLPSDRL